MKNKVDPKHIEQLVSELEFKFQHIEDTTTTVCCAFSNGFSVGFGMSACVDPAEFDFEKGCHIAQQRAEKDAINKLWELEGYLLKVTGMTSDEFPQ